MQNINSINSVVSGLFNEFWDKISLSQTSHLIGFGFGAIFVFVKLLEGDYLFGLLRMKVKVGMN
jgi:hypothetical protein